MTYLNIVRIWIDMMMYKIVQVAMKTLIGEMK